MENPFKFIRRSLSMKLGIWIVLVAALVFIFSLGFMFLRSLMAVYDEAVNRAEQVLDNTVLRVDTILDQVEVATDNAEWIVLRNLDKPDSMFVISSLILKTNPQLNGCSIAFEPNYFKGRGLYFSAYSYNDDGVILTTQEGNPEYEYFYLDWYQMVKLLDRPAWTEPFFDFNPNDIYSKDMIASYCKPLKDEGGNYVGTLSVDLSLGWLSNTISAVRPYPNSYCMMIGEGGTFFVHPDSTKLFYQTIFTETMDDLDSPMAELGHAMQRGEEGRRRFKIDGKLCYVFFKPIDQTGLSLAIVCQATDIFSGFIGLIRIISIIVVLGLLIMLLVFIRIVGRELKPLKKLAAQTGTIAKGNFDQTLLYDGREDEIGQLSHSFDDMQHSLVNYISELKRTTAAKASIESELKVASDIQMSMLPRVFPPFPERKEIDLFASMTPAKEVGGDLYNFLLLDDHLYFCVGDVSGKGVPASLFMAQATRLFRTLAGKGLSPEQIANRMNSALCEGNDTMMFVTMFIAMADLKTGMLDFCNCGHNPPLLDGKFIEFKYTNRPLGMWDGDPFHGESIADIHGKQILVYTDGLNEAMNKDKVQFGNECLQDLLSGYRGHTACQVVEMLKEAVEKHRDGADPNDDLTLLCLKLDVPQS